MIDKNYNLSNKKDELKKIHQNFQQILRTAEDVMCKEHSSLQTIYLENHPNSSGKGEFICEYCPSLDTKRKFYSNILSEYSTVINKIKSAASQNIDNKHYQTTIESCTENISQVEVSIQDISKAISELDIVLIPGIMSKIVTSEELFKLNEILKTISFNEQGKPIYENIGKHPERELQYVKLAKILVSLKGENFDMNKSFSVFIKEFILNIIKQRMEFVKKSAKFINFFISDFYELIIRLEGIGENDQNFLKNLNYKLYTQEEVDELLNSNKNKLSNLEMMIKELQGKINLEMNIRQNLTEEMIKQNQQAILKIKTLEEELSLSEAQSPEIEKEFILKFEGMQKELEMRMEEITRKAELEKSELLKSNDVQTKKFKELEENFKIVFSDKNNLILKVKEDENTISILNKKLQELTFKYSLADQKLSSLNELEDLRIKFKEAFISRKNLANFYNDEKYNLIEKINKLESTNLVFKNATEKMSEYENKNNALNQYVSELKAIIVNLENKINNETLNNKFLIDENGQLKSQLNSLSIENSNINTKLSQLFEENSQISELSILNISMLNDLKKQININKSLELTIQDLQEKIKVFNTRVQANELLIKNQLEIIKRYTEEKSSISIDQNVDLLLNSKKETDLIIEKIEKLERDYLYKSVIIPIQQSNINSINSSFSRSGFNSAFRPSSPLLNSSITNQSTFSGLNNSDLANTNRLLKSQIGFFNNMKHTINKNFTNDINNPKMSLENSNNSRNLQDRFRSKSNLLKKNSFRINFSKDLLLNKINWDYIGKWIEDTNIFPNPIQPKLLYKATRDGFSANNFKTKCWSVKNSLIIAKTNFGKIIGGFTPIPWENPNEPYVYVEDLAGNTFLFSCDNFEKFELKNKQYAVCLSQAHGPIFGGGSDFEIVDGCNLNYNKCSNIGHSYCCSRSPSEFYGSDQYLIEEYEVYQII